MPGSSLGLCGRGDMHFNVAQLLKEPIGAQRIHRLDEDAASLQETGASHIAGDLRFLRTEDGVWVQGAVDAKAASVCARCLEPFAHVMHFLIDDVWHPLIDVDTGARLPVPDGDVFIIDLHHVLDLREAVRQYVLTSAPMKPLCGSDCSGICPRCGAQLNYEECRCSGLQRDLRWGPLLDLLAQEQR